VGRFVRSQLLHRPSRPIALGVGILVAALTFTLLTSAVTTSAVEVRGTVQQNFRSAYDILVRPLDSYTPLEQEQGLVAANFASGIFGGISLRQWHQVEDIPGVDVAAPIANIGYVVPYENVKVLVNRYLDDHAWQLFRIRPTWVSNHGLAEYSADDSYVYYMARDRLVGGHLSGPYEELPNGRQVDSCFGFNRAVPPGLEPFTRGAQSQLSCFSARSPRYRSFHIFKPGEIGIPLPISFPIMMAAVDPVEEDRLVGLDDARISGRQLTEDLLAVSRTKPFSMLKIPVIASSRDFIADDLRVAIERLRVPDPKRLPSILASTRAYSYVTRLDGVQVGSRMFAASALYQLGLRLVVADTYWTASSMSYGGSVGGKIAALTTTNPDRSYQIPADGFLFDPANQDVQLRQVVPHPGLQEFPQVTMKVVGRFDPFTLRGFSPLSSIPLAAYAPPVVQPATDASRQALGGHPLQPTMNLGGYVQQPPLMLTTLDAARSLVDPDRFSGANSAGPISVIRVVVSGVTGPDPESLARIKSVAQLIAQRTGLAVDITAGSSPTEVRVHLPAGKFGSPALDLQESWVKKGVAVVILQALDRKSLALFLLVLVVTSLFLVNGALASVRARRTEIGTLLALGWSRRKVYGAVLGELLVVGLVAAVLGLAIAAALVSVFDLDLSVAQTLLVVPIAIVLAVLAGVIPALLASRGSPLDAVRPAVSESDHPRPVRGIVSMSLVNTRRVPVRTVLAAAGLFVGVGALTVLLSIGLAFRGTLVGTALGRVITLQIRPADYVAVAMVIVLGAASSADVMFLNIRERAAEFVTLSASGWGRIQLGELVTLEGLSIGLLGSVLGAATGLVVALVIAGSSSSLLVAAGLAAIGGSLLALLAALVPASLISRLAPPAVLAEE
jgi:putative ABC transport system permease protein